MSYEPPTADIKLNGETHKLFLQDQEPEMTHLPLLFHIIVKVLARIIREKNKQTVTGFQTGKGSQTLAECR